MNVSPCENVSWCYSMCLYIVCTHTHMPMVCLTAPASWLSINGNSQVSEIRTIEKLPEDLTHADSALTSPSKLCLAKGHTEHTCQLTSAWRKNADFPPSKEERWFLGFALSGSLCQILRCCSRAYPFALCSWTPVAPTCVLLRTVVSITTDSFPGVLDVAICQCSLA